MKTIFLISPYWKEDHRWMVSSVKLAELWSRLGYRVVVACMGSETKTIEVSDRITVHMKKDLFLPDPWNTGICFGFTGFARRLIVQTKPDHIVVNKILFWPSMSAIALRLRGYRITVLTDALVGMTWFPQGWLPRLVARVAAWTVGWLILRSAARVVFFHPQPGTLLQRLGIACKSRVIPTGIDPAPYGRAISPSTSLRAGHEPSAVSRQRNDAGVNITYVGRLESVKGIDTLLTAFAALMENGEWRMENVHVQLVGNGALRSVYEKRVQELGLSELIMFEGLRHDIPAVLAEADIFVLPSYSEGLSNALMEAMSSSCACVASDVGGNSFLVQNGVSGLLFTAGDSAALAGHLRRLIEDAQKRAQLGEAARKRIEDKFSWNHVGKQYEALFSEQQSLHPSTRPPGRTRSG